MTENDTGSFRLGALEEETREVPPLEGSELVELQIRNIHRRYRWFLVLVVVLVGVLFTVGYLDLTKRFSVQKTSGTREIENISTIFEDRFNELQKRIDALNESLSKEMAALDQKTVVWQKDLATLRNSVAKLDVSGTVKKEQKAVLLQVRKELTPLDKRLEALQSDLAGVEEKVRAQVAPLSETIARNSNAVEQLKNRIGPPATVLVNRDEMDLELLKIKKAYRQNLAAELSGLNKEIRLLAERVERLEVKPPPRPPQTTSGSPSSGNSQNTGTSGIQEQNIP